MHQLPIEQQILLIAEIAGLAILCIRMWAIGLHRVYVYFFGYLVLDLLQALIPLLVPLGSRLYVDLYVASQAFIVGFYVLVVLELYSKVLSDLTGIAGTARRYISRMLVVAAVIALLLLRLEETKATLTGYLMFYERTVMVGLVLFVLFVAAFLVYYPIPLGTNVIVYLMGYAVYFLTSVTLAFTVSQSHVWNRPLSSAAMGVSVACFVLWILTLSRKGENRRVVVGHQWNPADEQKLRAQLDAINASLLRAGGK